MNKKILYFLAAGAAMLALSQGEAMAFNFKDGVNIEVLTDEMQRVMAVVQAVWRRYVPDIRPTITSANDSKHAANSKHYENQALDFRTHDLPMELKAIMFDEVQAMLGGEYWSDFEYPGTSNEHLHVQYNG